MKGIAAYTLWLTLGCGVCQSANDLTRFEVASVKPSNPKEARHLQSLDSMRAMLPAGVGLTGNGTKLEAHDFTLQQLIATAYRISKVQVIGPDWLSETRFDVDAVIPADASRKQSNEMLQALLQERFALVAHRETRQQSGFVLTVTKGGPNLKVSGPPPAPSNDPPTAGSMAQNMRKPGLAGSSHYHMPRSTMRDFSEFMAQLLRVPVADKTGLTETYDVVIDVPPPMDTNDHDPQSRILDAIRKLGLNVKSDKIATPVVVVDSIQKAPTPN